MFLSTGTFLRGLIHLGEKRIPAGRVGDEPSVGLAEALYASGMRMGRLKTGTPPRLDGRTIDFSHLTEQQGDTPPVPFSFLTDEIKVPQVSCHLTYTTTETHEIIERNLSKSINTSKTSRVVPATSVTIAASLSARAFNRLDLPTFGRPARTIRKPSLNISPPRGSRLWRVKSSTNDSSDAVTV